MFPRIFKLLILCAILPLGASAAEGGLTLAEALARTLRGSPELAAYDFELRAAEARVLQAGLRPNPEMGFEVENPTGSGAFKNGEQMQNTLTLSQLLELGGKRSARITHAKAGAGVVQLEYQAKRVEALKATTLAFIETLAAQQRLELQKQIVNDSEETLKLTTHQVEVGKVGTVEAIRAKVALASARIEVEDARRDLAGAKGNLAAQWGAKNSDFDGVRGDLSRREAVPSIQTLQERLLGNPELRRWDAERDLRKAALAKERSLSRPDLTLQAGPRLEGKAEDVTFVAGVSLPLPFSNRNQGNIAEARANLAKLEEEKRGAEARSFAALNEAFQKLMGAAGAVDLLEQSVIPGAKEAEQLLRDGYAAGRFTQLEVLDARRTLIEARLKEIRSLAEFQKARAELDALTARPIELQSATQATSAMPAQGKH